MTADGYFCCHIFIGEKMIKTIKKYKAPYLFILPFFILFLVFQLIPTVWTFYISLTKWRGIGAPEFVGLDNFIYAFGDPYIITVILNTLIISVLGLLGLPLAGMIAILLSEVRGKKFKKTVQTAITIPNFISWIIIYSIMFSLFSNDGLLTTLFRGLSGNRDSTVTLLTNPGSAKLFMVMTNIWKTVGYNSIIFFAAVTGIDSQLYDAAAVDGAGRWQKIVHITIPGILPTFITLLIISVGAILNNGFEQYYVFVNPMIQKNIEVLDYYVYRIGMLNNDIPASTAVSMIKTFISVILVFSVNKLSKRALGQSIL